ncbi:hypothetical protein KR074_001885, partial [Drosophila pseudoananassae]
KKIKIKMNYLKNVTLHFLLCALAQGTENDQLQFLNKFIRLMQNEDEIQNLITFQQSRNRNCTLQNWNPRRIPILRSNELGSIKTRWNFGRLALALVCIDLDFDLEILSTVGKSFNLMQQERVILWLQQKPSKEFFKDLSGKMNDLKFARVIVLEMDDSRSGLRCLYRMNPHPTPSFTPMNFSFPAFKGSFFKNKVENFQGRNVTAQIEHESDTSMKMNYRFFQKGSGIIHSFAKHYNLSLKLIEGNGSTNYDFLLNNYKFINKDAYTKMIDFYNPYFSTSLIIVVPCESEMSMMNVYEKLDIRTWFAYLLCVYCSFMVAEIFIIWANLRMSGDRRLPSTSQLLSLRAIQGILGLSFRVNNRASFSLRQLFLAISIFGMIFSSFFSSKLSAMLTKPFHQAQVKNFDDLQQSGLTILANKDQYRYLKNEFDREITEKFISNVKQMEYYERMQLLLSLNNSYAYIIYGSKWPSIEAVQKLLGSKALCSSEDLTIVNNIPMTHEHPPNSIFKKSLAFYQMFFYEMGLTSNHLNDLFRTLRQEFNMTLNKRIYQLAVPLTFENLHWVWCLLMFGYLFALIAFLGEIYFYNKNVKKSRFRQRNKIIV